MRTRTTRGLLAATVLAASVVVTTGAAPATAAPGGGGPGGQVSGGSGGGVLTAEVHVTITGSAVGNGGTSSGGGRGGSGSVTVRTPVACYWDSLGGAYTGATMYQRLVSSPQDWTLHGEASYLPSADAVTAHKDDDGVWYTVAPGPRSDVSDGGWDDVTAGCMSKLRAGAGPGNGGGNSGYLFVPPGTAPPTAPPTPPTAEQMRDASLAALTLPVPTMARNPVGLTLVNFDTWFTVPGAQFREWDITATAGQPATSATVTATPAGLALTAGGSVLSRCSHDQAVSAYAAGSAPDAGCTHAFTRASVGQPGLKYPVQGITSYDTAWTSVVAGAPGPGGPLAAQLRTGETDVPVAETQALVSGAS